MEKNCLKSFCWFGRWNWSPPKAATQGFIPPVPIAIRLKPQVVKPLEEQQD